MAQAKTIQGFKAFSKFCQTKRPQWASAPILLLTPSSDDQQQDPLVSETCQKATFLFQQQLGLRTLVSSSMDPFPKDDQIQQTQVLSSRAAATETIVGVGTGGCLDMAKILATSSLSSSSQQTKELLLIPSTLLATIVAASPGALCWDAATQSVHAVATSNSSMPATIGLWQDDSSSHVNILELQTAIYACMTIALDGMLRACSNPDATKLFHDCCAILSHEIAIQEEDNEEQESMINLPAVQLLLLRAGSLLEYGVDKTNVDQTRSLPVALTASLLPHDSFSHYHPLVFWASLAPSLAKVAQSHDVLPEDYDALCRKGDIWRYAPNSMESVPVDELLQHVHETRTTWGCRDLSDTILQAVLQEHVV